MGYLYRSHGCIPACTYPYPLSTISQVPPQKRHLPVCQPTLRSGNGSSSFHQPCQGGKTSGSATRNQATSIPRRLVNPCPLQGGVPLTNTTTTQSDERLRLCSKPQEVRTPSLPEVRLPRIPFFTELGSCEAHPRQVDKTSGDVPSPLSEVCYHSTDSYVHHWIACINGEDCEIGQDAYETFSVTSQDSLEISDTSGEWWLDPQNVLQGEFLHPREHEKLIFTDASNAGWGTHSGQESTGGLWSHPEKHLHINLLQMKAVFLALQFFKRTCQNNQVLIASDNTSVVAYINKQGGTRSAELCALMWRILTWCNRNSVTLKRTTSPGGTRSNQQNGPFLHKSSNKFPNFGRVPKWTYSQPA